MIKLLAIKRFIHIKTIKLPLIFLTSINFKVLLNSELYSGIYSDNSRYLSYFGILNIVKALTRIENE